ncbi:hypothetical protein HMH01_00985 [Halovulum dunhuangense]|uniref:Uncharacterized protein n=1 Tax=Halovulum dunhuangense TaxID=1505036 RepID=A0A849KQ92_9RHOB|nr:hypothetical protein [Halovulum dunhuangense]NNU78999.1 hypothetical protein [Halovulum dunhuangense]
MPAPIAPIAMTALRLGAVAAAAWYVRSRTQAKPKHVWREQALDDLPEGVDLTSDKSEAERNAHAAARVRRVIRLGDGPGLEIDIATLGRIRLRRVD